MASKHTRKPEARPQWVKKEKKEKKSRLDSDDSDFICANVSNVGGYKRNA